MGTSKLFALLLALVVTGCKSEKEPELPPGPIGFTHVTSAEAPAPRSQQPAEAETVRVVVTSRMRTLCGMPDAPPVPSDFVFDGTQLRPRGEDVLQVVARCLTTTAPTESRTCISGYIAPLGKREFELNLGRAHAEAATRYLEEHGVRSDRMHFAVRDGATLFGGRVEVPADRHIEIDLQGAAGCRTQF
jgi:outer membrane protein OmpA-like peptidoglycan-associated protein